MADTDIGLDQLRITDEFSQDFQVSVSDALEKVQGVMSGIETKWQQKRLDSNFTGNDTDITDLSFTNLDSTKTYKLTVTLKVVVTSGGAGIYVRDAASGGGKVLHTFRPFKHTYTITVPPGSGTTYTIASDQHEVVAGTIIATGVTSLYLHAFEFNETDVVQGGTANDDKQSKVLLEELPFYKETTEW